MALFNQRRYRALRQDHGRIISFTLSVDTAAWFIGWGIFGLIVGALV